MPLTPGAPVSDTIKELYHNGTRKRPMKQIVAIAYANARKGGQQKPSFGPPQGSRFKRP